MGLATSAVLMPVTANPFDIALITGTANSWLSWHVPLFLFWKFGADYAFANVAAVCAARVLSTVGLSVPTATHIAFKLMLIVAYVLSAIALWNLALELRPRLAVPLVTMWLLSPAVIWVAAGHAQIEPVASALTLLSLWMLIQKRWLLAGVICGLGVGFEYVPLVALITLAILMMSGRARWPAGLRFAVGLVTSLAVSFGPLVATSVARESFMGGLIGNATARGAAINVKPGSVWYLAGPPAHISFIESHWLFMLVGVAVAVTVIGTIASRRGSLAAPFAAAGVILVTATIIDPTTLVQFAVLALTGLCLVALDVDIAVALVFLPPVITVVAFTFSGPVYTYLEDSDPQVFAQLAHLLPQTPTSPQTYAGLATVAMVLEVIVLVIWAVRSPRLSATTRTMDPSRPPRSGPSSVGVRAVVALEVSALLMAVSWTAQAQVWSHLVGAYPGDLFDTPFLTSQRPDTSTSIAGATISATFDPVLAHAAAVARPRPALEVKYTSQNIWRQEAAGGSPHPSQSVSLPVTLPSQESEVRVASVDFTVLAHSQQWLTPEKVNGQAVLDGQVVAPLRVQMVAAGWAMLTYAARVKPTLASATHRTTMHLRMLSNTVTLNASPAGSPWAVAWLGSGSVLVDTSGGQKWAAFDSAPFADGSISGGRGRLVLPWAGGSSSSVRIPAINLLASSVSEVVLSWRGAATAFARPSNGGQWGTGVGYLVGLGVALALLVLKLARAERAGILWRDIT